MKQKTTYMIFNNMKQYDLLVKVFILLKLVELRLKGSKQSNMVEFNDKSRPRSKEGK